MLDKDKDKDLFEPLRLAIKRAKERRSRTKRRRRLTTVRQRRRDERRRRGRKLVIPKHAR